jgi:hypothetical protein
LAATIEADFFDDLKQSCQLSVAQLEQSALLGDESFVDHILKRES